MTVIERQCCTTKGRAHEAIPRGWRGSARADACSRTSAVSWSTSVPFTNVVATKPFKGGGYGATPPVRPRRPGSCRLGDYNANLSESWIAVQPGTENLVGTSKVFFEKFTTFYNFHLGSITFVNGMPAGTTSSRATSASRPAPRRCRRAGRTTPTRTSTSTRRAAPTRRRCLQRVLGEPAPELEHRDRLQRRPRTELGEGERRPAARACAQLVEPVAFGFVEDKQWLAVDHFAGTRFQTASTRPGRSSTASRRRSSSRLARPRADVLEGGHAQRAEPDRPGEHVRLPGGRRGGNVYVAYVGWVDSPRRTGRDDLRLPVIRRRRDVGARSLPSRRPARDAAAATRTPASGSASSRTSRPARPIRATCT